MGKARRVKCSFRIETVRSPIRLLERLDHPQTSALTLSPKLLIFDCDGVLVDSEPIAVRVDVQVIRSLGREITEQEVIEQFVGLSNASMWKLVSDRLGVALPPDWDVQYDDLYREAFKKDLRPIEGILEALDVLTIPTCVASSGSHEKMQFTLRLTGLYSRFEGRIFSASDVKHDKPAPDLFLHAAQKMGVAPEDCLVVEDSPYGIEAARRAGMRAIGYAGGLTSAERLRGPHVAVIQHMSELLGVIL